MSDSTAELLQQLLTDNNLLDAAEKVGESMYRLRWGSATVVTGIVGESIVVIAPLFESLPSRKQDFALRLLEINGELGGTASFALQKSGSVVLQIGRGIRGLDAEEFGLMLGTVGKFADDYDDLLEAEYYK